MSTLSFHAKESNGTGLFPHSEKLPPTDATIDQLALYVRDHLGHAEMLGRKLGVHLWLAGKALQAVHEKLVGERKWTEWARHHEIKLSTAYECLKIARTFERVEDLTGLTGVEARMIAGIHRPKPEPEPVVEEVVPPTVEETPRPDTAEKTAAKKDASDATREAVTRIKSIVTTMRGLKTDRKRIKWESLRDQWMDAVKLMRELDQSLAVDVYSFYTTPRETVEYLLDREQFEGEVWEPCSGDGAISRVLEERGYKVHSSDLRDSPGVYGEKGVDARQLEHAVNCVTNPPFVSGVEIARRLIGVTTGKVALLLRVEMLASARRRGFFRDHPPARIYTLAKRPPFRVGGLGGKKQSTKWEYAWYVWEKGLTGNTEVIH